MTSAPRTVIVLQGGGALGAYQGGVCEILTAQGYSPDWLVGTSIGAINSAILAGNPPERRMERLRAFWQRVSRDDALPSGWPEYPFTAWLLPWIAASGLWDTLTRGVPGFFEPRQGAMLNINQDVPPAQASFYDTAPLQKTLEDLVDFDYLNAGHVRCTVCAVDVATAEMAVFDSARQRLTVAHIMASSALPPGFPPVIIDGRAYWDGGIYSNTPVDIVMDDAERQDTLCFMVDLWDPTEASPRSISGVLARQKDIQFASRTREHLEDHRKMQDMRRAIDILSRHLPDTAGDDPVLARLSRLGCGSTVNIVRMIMQALPTDDHNKDIDFSRSRMEARWQAGTMDALRVLQKKRWLHPLPPEVGMMVHELEPRERSA